MDLLFHSDVLTSSIFVLDKKLTPSLVLFPQLSSEAEHDHQKNIPLLNMVLVSYTLKYISLVSLPVYYNGENER